LSLNELDIQEDYRSDRDNLIDDFYIPCLERATVYSRAVGFFSSSSLIAVSKGLTAKLACLAWLLSQGILEIKLAISQNLDEEGLYQEKFGIFSDYIGNCSVSTITMSMSLH
jgi:hypothetical protein